MNKWHAFSNLSTFFQDIFQYRLRPVVFSKCSRIDLNIGITRYTRGFLSAENNTRYFEKIFLEADTWSAFPVFNFGAHARDAK